VHAQQVGGGAGEEGVAGGADIGRAELGVGGGGDGIGQAQAAILLRERGRQEAAGDVGVDGLLHLGNHVHVRAVEMRLVGIGLGRVRQKLLLGQLVAASITWSKVPRSCPAKRSWRHSAGRSNHS